jgi:hypothetical protein
MMQLRVDGVPFECGRSCETILRKGDVAYLVDGQIICPDCADRERQ